MKNFKEFGIKPQIQGLIGEKIQIFKILNKEITITDFKIEDSKYKDKGSGKCLHLQIELNGNKHIVFTGSSVLMNTITQIPKDSFPFKSTIIKENDRYEFT